MLSLQSCGNSYEHNILSQSHSASKVSKEQELIRKKRDIKERQKKAKLMEKKVQKLTEHYIKTKQKLHIEGICNPEDMEIAKQMEVKLADVRRSINLLQVKRNSEQQELDRS